LEALLTRATPGGLMVREEKRNIRVGFALTNLVMLPVVAVVDYLFLERELFGMFFVVTVAGMVPSFGDANSP
jgi:hypothetical protein